MKKKVLALSMCLAVCLCMAACAQKEAKGTAQEGNTQSEETAQEDTRESEETAQEGNTQSEETAQNADTDETSENEQEQKQLKGTMDEIKDFMFVIKTEDDKYYAFPYDENTSIDLNDVAVGDSVLLTYTGTISEVDPFSGEIISLEKQ